VAGFTVTSIGRWLLYSLDRPWKKGANFMCTLLFHVLLAVKSSLGPASAALALQVFCDSGKENWNYTLLRFLGAIVLARWFGSVFLSSLVPDHTKNKQDQIFRSQHVYIEKHDVHSLPHLLSQFPGAYPGEMTRPTPVLIEAVGDFEDWLEPYGFTYTGISKLHAFWIFSMRMLRLILSSICVVRRQIFYFFSLRQEMVLQAV
jgi:hypothetical protein